MEQRGAVRFSLLAPVIYRWKDPSGKNRSSVGCTRDISILGAFIVCPSPPPVQTPVSVEIHLPPIRTKCPASSEVEGQRQSDAGDRHRSHSGFAATSCFELHEWLC